MASATCWMHSPDWQVPLCNAQPPATWLSCIRPQRGRATAALAAPPGGKPGQVEGTGSPRG
eukprot:15139672-Alexandrium_andersonii.AAC.1